MQTFHSIWLLNIQLRNVYVLKLLIMLEISLITVIYKRIGKFWYITQSELNSCKWRYFH
jgi:type IV secretory pathway TraG/TraD family ATPase VirD4